MRNIGTILTCLCLVSTSVFGQKARTYLGKGNLVELNYQGYMPVFADNNFYEIDGNKLNQSKNKQFTIHNGFQLLYTRHLYKRISVGVEFGMNRSYYVESRNMTGDNGSFNTFLSGPMPVRINSYIGKFEFGSREGIFPIGINHQVGFGVLTAGLLERKGDLKLVDGISAVNTTYETTWNSIQGYTLFYDLTFRVPLSDRILLNVGLRYHANWFRKADFSNVSPNDIDPYRFRDEMSQTVNFNLIRLHTGLGFSF